MAEEQRCQEAHRLCANNCGFFGSPATMNLCSKCYRDFRLKEEHASSAKIAVENSLLQASSSSSAASVAMATAEQAVDEVVRSPLVDAASQASELPPAAVAANRCATCRKRTGLTGFKCRCGSTYCGAHRYPEQHACGFDFKTAGREAIAKANPVVKAHKLEKI